MCRQLSLFTVISCLLNCIFSLLFLPDRYCHAHPVSLSLAVVNVEEKQIEVDLEIMLEDLVLYHAISAGSEGTFSADDLRAAAKKHREFVLQYFSILDGSGNRLKGSIGSENFDAIAADGVAQADLMRSAISFHIVYPISESRPKFLTFVQNFGGPTAALPAVMDVHVLQNGKFFNVSEKVVHGRPQTVELDWDQKDSEAAVTFAEMRKQRAQQTRERLGISSFTELFSFLYITHFEVRHEVLIPLLTLEQWLPVPRKHTEFLEVEEQAVVRGKIEEFFQKNNTVTINGKPVAAKLTRLNFFMLDINDFALNAEPRRVNVHQARVGAILTFPSAETPRTVTMNWNTFSDFAPYMQTILLVGNERPQRFTFQKQTTKLDWTGDLTGPMVVPIAAPPGRLTETSAQNVIQSLLTNVYRAFDFREDEDVYDSLNSGVSGKLLREMYLRIKRTLLLAEQGGAMSYVTSVDVKSVAPISSGPSDTFEVAWRVTSVSEHWGHIHTRESEFRGRLTLARQQGNWKLEKFQLVDEKRIRFETSIRGNDPN